MIRDKAATHAARQALRASLTSWPEPAGGQGRCRNAQDDGRHRETSNVARRNDQRD
jgi:hypothetical protein